MLMYAVIEAVFIFCLLCQHTCFDARKIVIYLSRDRYPTFDVYVVEGILGTYIANVKSSNKNRGYTMISFDKGGEWNTVMPPVQDSKGQPITCNLACAS